MNSRNYAWVPSDFPRWNPFAIKESGVGRTLARILTEQANTSYHHGLLEQRPPNFANPFSQWLDAGTNSLGFPGRLKYRPVEKYPLRPYEVKEALEQAEKNLRLAFELDPGNYVAYDVYLFFLTNQITQTEFASMNGTQLKDDDDDDHADAGGGAKQRVDNGKNGSQSKPLLEGIRQWEGQELERRHTRAIEITDEALRKFRMNTEDPERILTAAVMWYNRFLLLAPEVADRLKSEEARKKFEEVGRPTLDKMKYYIQLARAHQHELEKKGLWQAIPERRKEFLQVAKLMEKSMFSLAVALQNNRSGTSNGQLGSNVWAPSDQN
jgi:tetratricopeptide (TPR) repeat protein